MRLAQAMNRSTRSVSVPTLLIADLDRMTTLGDPAYLVRDHPKRTLVSYWSLLADSVKATGLAFATVIALLVGFVIWVVDKTATIPAWGAVPLTVAILFLVVIHVDALAAAAK